jgi:ABC-type transport system involved in cytochrome bd biosynthesis fused ATPase/permease subunit
MNNQNKKDDPGLIKGVTTAYVILILHVILIAVVGLLVVFFRGIINYMLWIFIGFAILMITSGYYLYRRSKRQAKELNETLKSPAFNGRSVEVNLLGGLASFRIGQSTQPQALDTNRAEAPLQLESPETTRIRKLSELAKLYENEMISVEEFDTLKSRIINE